MVGLLLAGLLAVSATATSSEEAISSSGIRKSDCWSACSAIGDVPRSLCEAHERDRPMPRPWHACRDSAEAGKTLACERACGFLHTSDSADTCKQYRRRPHGKVFYAACQTGASSVKGWVLKKMPAELEKLKKTKEQAQKRVNGKGARKRRLRRKKSHLRPAIKEDDGESVDV